jgi:F-type H+-transporting ATPase subunit b
MFLATLWIATSADEPAPPLIDLDWTVLVQFGLFLIMLVGLWRLLFKPYLALRDAREAGIGGARKRAQEMAHRAEDLGGQYEQRMHHAKLRGAEERARLRSEGAAEERQLLGTARDESQRALGEARTRVSTQAQSARAKLEAQSTDLARQVATKILGREVAS